MNYYIVTGTSRGIGEAIAKRLIAPRNVVFGLSRSANRHLQALARDKNGKYVDVAADLSEVDEIARIMSGVFSQINKSDAQTVMLINNAGVLEPMKPVGKLDNGAIAHNMKVNLIAPMILANCFIAEFADVQADKRVINISSGAGKHPYHGWSHYCSSKAGLDMFTRVVALEQQGQASPAKIISIAPGVVDTQMQTEIRRTSKEDFREVERFIALKETGSLRHPDEVAAQMIQLIHGDFDNGAILDLRK